MSTARLCGAHTTTQHRRSKPLSTEQIRVRRGDLAVIERINVSHSTTEGRTETTEYVVMVVSNLTREGRIKAVRDTRWSDSGYAQPLERMAGFQRVHTVAQADIDVDAATAAARAHVYPGSITPRPYASLDDVRAALAPHRTGGGK
jgi:hypothetical protein